MPLQQEFGWSTIVLSAAVSINLVLFDLMAPFAATGSMALVFAATIANTWFVTSRGLVIGILTAGSAGGQLVFLPFIAMIAQDPGWLLTG